MQDMRNNESDLTSDISTSDVTSSTSNINKYVFFFQFSSIINALLFSAFIGHIKFGSNKKKSSNNNKYKI